MAIRLLIFDLDGTLVDSSVDISNALNHAIQPYGMDEVSVAETITLVGEGVTRLIGKLIERRGRDLDVPALLKRFVDFYSAHSADHTTPYPGAAKVLESLAGCKKAIVSNKLESLSVKVLEALDLLKYFDYVAGADTTSEKKPSPIPVLDVLSRFDTLPGEALFIGDSIYDMEAARAAGVRTVAALYGYGAPGFSSEADYRINAIGELPDVVRVIDGKT